MQLLLHHSCRKCCSGFDCTLWPAAPKQRDPFMAGGAYKCGATQAAPKQQENRTCVDAHAWPTTTRPHTVLYSHVRAGCQHNAALRSAALSRQPCSTPCHPLPQDESLSSDAWTTPLYSAALAAHHITTTTHITITPHIITPVRAVIASLLQAAGQDGFMDSPLHSCSTSWRYFIAVLHCHT